MSYFDLSGPAVIVAEISASHKQDYTVAEKLVKVAKEVGVDAVKFQTINPNGMAPQGYIIPEGCPWSGRDLWQLYNEAMMPWKWHRPLGELATSLGLTWFSTPYDRTAVDFLDGLDVPCFKIASFELNDDDFLRYVASKGRPVILSTGMATLEEVRYAYSVLREHLEDNQIVLLKCTTAYPAPLGDLNLAAIATLKEVCPNVGYSHHAKSLLAPSFAVLLGAQLIEAHLTLGGGLDGSFALTPDDFYTMVQVIREAELVRGENVIAPAPSEIFYQRFRRYLHDGIMLRGR